MACIFTLPPEVLLLIFDELYTAHSRSLVAFACTNKHSHQLAKTVLLHGHHRTLSFTVNLPRLADDIQRCALELQRGDGSFNAVRRLIITSPRTRQDKEDSGHATNHEAFDWRDSASLGPQAIDSLGRVPTGQYRLNSSRCELDNSSWIPFAGLLRRLPRLTDLIYLGSSQFPPCMLEALHTYIPSCRLYLHSFMLSSILREDGLDEYDYKLVTSPSLYSIGIEYHDVNGYSELHNFHKEAVLRMVYGLTPNLKEIYINPDYLPATPPGYPLPPGYRWRTPWQGFTQDRKLPETFHKGSLECIQVFRVDDVTREYIEEWDRYTDFSTLRVLKLCLMQRHIDLEALQYLSRSNFISLETLELWIEKYDRFSFRKPRSTPFIDATGRFLRSLPVLTALNLQGWQPDIDLEVLQYSRLRKLHLRPAKGEFLSLENLNQISKYCPLLSSLATSIHRARGDANEVAMYKAFGSMAKLADLVLTLDVIEPKFLLEEPEWAKLSDNFDPYDIPSDPSFDKFGQEWYTGIELEYYNCPRNGHIRDGLINSAIDADLACSIFRTINSTKPAGSTLLRSMTVCATNTHYMRCTQNGAFRRYCDLLQYLGAEWRVERKDSSLAGHSLIATKTENESLEGWSDSFDMALGPDLGSVFRRLWPARNNSHGWNGEWHSFPLATGGNDA